MTSKWMRGCVVRRMGTGSRVMTRRLVMGTTDHQSIRSMGNDARVDGRPTDDEDESGRVSRCVRVCAFSRYRRSTVRAHAMDTNARKNVSVVFPCNQFVWVNSMNGGDRHHHQPRGASSSAIDADVRRRDARGASSEHRARVRSFVRSFVRSLGTSSTRRPRRDARRVSRGRRRRRTGNRSVDHGIRRDVDARRVSSSVSRPSTRRRLRRRFRPRSRARGERARAGR